MSNSTEEVHLTVDQEPADVRVGLELRQGRLELTFDPPVVAEHKGYRTRRLSSVRLRRDPSEGPEVKRHKIRKALDRALLQLVQGGLDNPTKAAFVITMNHKARTSPDEILPAARALVRAFEERGETLVLHVEPERPGNRITWPGVCITSMGVHEIKELMARCCAGGVNPQWVVFMEGQPTRQLAKWFQRKDAKPSDTPPPFSDKRWAGSRRYWTRYLLKDPTLPLPNSLMGCGPLWDAVTGTGCSCADDSLTDLLNELYWKPESEATRQEEKLDQRTKVRKRYGLDEKGRKIKPTGKATKTGKGKV